MNFSFYYADSLGATISSPMDKPCAYIGHRKFSLKELFWDKPHLELSFVFLHKQILSLIVLCFESYEYNI